MNKAESYRWASKRIRAQVLRNLNTVSTLANVAAILKEYFNFFWVGFYSYHGDHLLLGPFQGPPACVKLDIKKGVCGKSAREKKTIIVADVYEFSDHVACDARSKAEIVLPLFDENDKLQAVLDIDSDKVNDFDQIDKDNLTAIAELLKPIWK